MFLKPIFYTIAFVIRERTRSVKKEPDIVTRDKILSDLQ